MDPSTETSDKVLETIIAVLKLSLLSSVYDACVNKASHG